MELTTLVSRVSKFFIPSLIEKFYFMWNLVLTNVPAETLNSKIILEIYRLRWQIEILFKMLKNKGRGGASAFKDSTTYFRWKYIILIVPAKWFSLNTAVS